ncbi:MAG: protoporphyrinogen oxidase [Marmoricola sp.]
MSRVAVVGGGIAGLSAASQLRSHGVEVVVLEAGPAVGGKLRLGRVGGVQVDLGAEAMLARRPEGVALAEAAGLGDAIVHPATTESMLWNRDRLVPLPRTFMGVPGDVKVLDEVLSRAGQMRASVESRLPETELLGNDVSIGFLVEERLGREVVDRLVEPLLGGVYAGFSREISAQAAVPQLLNLLAQEGSLTKAAAVALSRPSTGPVFAGLAGGIGQLPPALAARLKVETGAEVSALSRVENGWQLVAGDRSFDADAVVLATPAFATARLVRDVAPLAAHELGRIEYASMAIVTLAFAMRDFPPVSGSGFLVPAVDGHDIKAATFSHRKWQWVADAGEAEGVVVMRCSLGRHRDDALERDDAELIEMALADLGKAIGLSSRPVDAHVQRWVDGLPQYAVGHVDRVALIRSEIARQSGLAVCGAAYDGVGIPACSASATEAVAQVLGHLGRMGA